MSAKRKATEAAALPLAKKQKQVHIKDETKTIYIASTDELDVAEDERPVSATKVLGTHDTLLAAARQAVEYSFHATYTSDEDYYPDWITTMDAMGIKYPNAAAVTDAHESKDETLVYSAYHYIKGISKMELDQLSTLHKRLVSNQNDRVDVDDCGNTGHDLAIVSIAVLNGASVVSESFDI